VCCSWAAFRARSAFSFWLVETAGQGEPGFGSGDSGVHLVQLDAELIGVDPTQKVPLGDLLALMDQDLFDHPQGLGADFHLDGFDDAGNLENTAVRGLLSARGEDDEERNKDPCPGDSDASGHEISPSAHFTSNEEKNAGKSNLFKAISIYFVER
jgi:hypothetical protein